MMWMWDVRTLRCTNKLVCAHRTALGSLHTHRSSPTYVALNVLYVCGHGHAQLASLEATIQAAESVPGKVATIVFSLSALVLSVLEVMSQAN